MDVSLSLIGAGKVVCIRDYVTARGLFNMSSLFWGGLVTRSLVPLLFITSLEPIGAEV